MNAPQTLPALRVEELPEEFFIDLAVGTNSFVEICDNYGIDAATADTLEADPVFTRRLRIATQVVEDDGRAFRSRCRVAVTNSVHHIVHMMQDSDVPASTQLDAFKTLVKYGDLEPATKGEGVGGPSLVLQIVGPGGEMQDVLGGAVVAKEPPDSSALIEDASFEEVTDGTDRNDTHDANDAVAVLNIVAPAAAAAFGVE